MIKPLFPHEPLVYFCLNCDAEFTIKSAHDDGQQVEFCPYCGIEIDYEVDDDEEETDID